MALARELHGGLSRKGIGGDLDVISMCIPNYMIAQRLADCIEDPRAPERVRHTLAEMIRYRALLIAAGYPDGNDCDALKSDPAFKMAVGRLPESGADLCSHFGLAGLRDWAEAVSGRCRRCGPG